MPINKLKTTSIETDAITADLLAAGSVTVADIPDAEITFDENGKYTPFIDEQDDSKIREELSFKPRTLKQGIKEHMNEARLDNGLSMLD